MKVTLQHQMIIKQNQTNMKTALSIEVVASEREREQENRVGRREKERLHSI